MGPLAYKADIAISFAWAHQFSSMFCRYPIMGPLAYAAGAADGLVWAHYFLDHAADALEWAYGHTTDGFAWAH
jgi:hypothetical protein